jgi:hypothetical protein
VGEGKREMGRLPEAVEGSEPDRPKELVGSRVLHGALAVNIVQDRRCLEMDVEAMAWGKGGVGKGEREMGRLPEAV